MSLYIWTHTHTQRKNDRTIAYESQKVNVSFNFNSILYILLSKKNYNCITLNVSRKNTFTVQSSSATAISLEFAETDTHRTFSSSFKVRVCSNDNTLALLPDTVSGISSSSQNFTVQSPPPVATPVCNNTHSNKER